VTRTASECRRAPVGSTCEGQRVHRPVILALACIAAAGCRRSAPKPAPSAPAPAPAPAAAAPASKERDAVAALIGTTPPEWQAERWLNSPPLSLASLRGSVVLVRWWTAGCPFCSASAPALRAFHRDYAARGLKVVGMYHHKEDTPFDPRVYEDTARKYEFAFPLAVDPDWRTLESWLHDADGHAVSTGWTSITFVLDKHGVLRHVHPGGQYLAGEPAHDELRAAIERLLAES
jgi:peroxiredoxin